MMKKAEMQEQEFLEICSSYDYDLLTNKIEMTLKDYYLCGILSSTLVANCVKSYMNPTSISAHVLDKLYIPTFDKNNYDHIAIARECKEGHGQKDITGYIDRIDAIVSRIYQ